MVYISLPSPTLSPPPPPRHFINSPSQFANTPFILLDGERDCYSKLSSWDKHHNPKRGSALQEKRCLRYLWIIFQSTAMAYWPLYSKTAQLSCSRSKKSEQQADFLKALIIFYVCITVVEFVEVYISFLRSKPSSIMAVNLKFEMIGFATA